MMDLMERGGAVMWPLLLLSIVAAAVILERLMAYLALKLGDAPLRERLLSAAKNGDAEDALDEVREQAPALEPLVAAVFAPGRERDREREAAVAVEDLLNRLDARLGVLAVTARVAPLLGLLGTVLGMIQTFSHLSSMQGAVDMTSLADGIWQALLTTAAGLSLAVPVVLAHQWFLRRQASAASSLQRLANLLLARRPHKPGDGGAA